MSECGGYGFGGGFAFLVMLFILLIIVGCSCFGGQNRAQVSAKDAVFCPYDD
ncbi:hypothetical protein PMEGAS67_51360 [Priestia megaterium]